jgi:hypothetical protein
MLQVAEEIKSLERENGNLDPNDVVERARDVNSPMHGFFEWDDNEAAKQYRINQACLLIRRVKVQVTVRDVDLDVVRYVRDPEASGQYSNILRVRGEEARSRDVVVDEMARVKGAAKRARAVATVLGTTAQVDEIIRLAEIVVRQAGIQDQPQGEA